MNKTFLAEVLKLAPEFSVVDHYFYEEPVGHILCGFLCERSPSGAYISSYAFPLYDRFRFLHLNFSDELPYPDGFMEAPRGREKELAAEFIRRIEPYKPEVASLASLEQFAKRLEARPSLKNPWTRRGYAVTLIMLHRRDEAMSELAALSALDYVKQTPDFDADITRLVNDLSEGIEVAKKTLEGWEAETRERLGLLPS